MTLSVAFKGMRSSFLNTNEVNNMQMQKLVTYEQAREYLERFIHARLYQKIEVGAGDEHDPMGRMKAFLQLLENPQDSYPCVIVSGTSGKGSTTYLIAQMLTTAGYTTGLTISPHLQKINERMSIGNNGILTTISDKDLIELLNDMIPIITQMEQTTFGSPTYYEILMALTLMYFKKKKVDIAIIEVGLEGKFEATNLLFPLIFVLTNISFDHVAILGDTIEKIADEATYRIKALCPIKGKTPCVITAASQDSVKKLVITRANTVGATVSLAFTDFSYSHVTEVEQGITFSYASEMHTLHDVFVSLRGTYQAENCSLAIRTIELLSKFGFTVSNTSLYDGLSRAFFAGRFERQLVNYGEHTIELILDGAHNEAKMTAFLESVSNRYAHKKKVFLIAFKKDKNIKKLLQLIQDQADACVVTEFVSSTDLGKNLAMSTSQIQEIVDTLPTLKEKALFVPLSTQALQRSVSLAQQYDAVVFVTGSLYLVGEIRTCIARTFS